MFYNEENLISISNEEVSNSENISPEEKTNYFLNKKRKSEFIRSYHIEEKKNQIIRGKFLSDFINGNNSKKITDDDINDISNNLNRPFENEEKNENEISNSNNFEEKELNNQIKELDFIDYYPKIKLEDLFDDKRYITKESKSQNYFRMLNIFNPKLEINKNFSETLNKLNRGKLN
jgi:hypothetical protein